MYNGWLHAVFAIGTLCFGADGCIIWSNHNCPSSWNDADMSADFSEKLLDLRCCPDQRMGVVADSAFPNSKDMTDRILTTLKDGDLGRLLPSRRRAAEAKHNAVVSIRQAADWGMGSIDKAFHRLHLPSPFDPNTRRVRLNNIFTMSNSGCARRVSRRLGRRSLRTRE